VVRVLMLAWEYPPRVIGGLAHAVAGLSGALVRAGHEVTVLTLHEPTVADDAVVDGVRLLRARTDLPWLPPENFVAQMASANHQLVQLTARLDGWAPHVVHAHDWLVAWTGDTLKALWRVPLVATIHATEKGRNHGFVPGGQPAAINAVEWWLTYQARHVIACSQFMVNEVLDAFGPPPDKVHMVPNGVDAGAWTPPDPTSRREEQLVVSWGRVQYEKGFQTLLDATAQVRRDLPGLRVVIAGRGSHLEALQQQANHLGLQDVVTFAGFVPDDELRDLLHRCSLAVIPSLYEPFGMVALEALAAGAPIIASTAGGLGKVLSGSGAAALFEPGDVDGLAAALRRVLSDPITRASMQDAAPALLAHYTWDAIAERTLPLYEDAQRP
jgi:glycogen(starch) synthase